MADRTDASIKIGGKLSANLIPALVAAANLDNGRSDWDGPPLEEADIQSGEPLSIYASQIAWGRFDHVEQFCLTNNLAYRLRAGSSPGSFGPSRRLYDGKGHSQTFEENEDGDVVLALGSIRALGSMQAIETWFAAARAPVPQLVLVHSATPIVAAA